MTTELDLNGRINLTKAQVLLFDDSPESLSILVQIVTGFGVKTIHRCRNLAAAKQAAYGDPLDLILANANARDSAAYDLVNWLRRSNLDPNSFAPVILVSGHTRVSDVQKARDCGANFIVAKPISPAVLLERILWVAREKRPFIAGSTYLGPDRRFHELGPPNGIKGRRAEDQHTETELDAAGH